MANEPAAAKPPFCLGRISAFQTSIALAPWPTFLLYECYTCWFGGWCWGYRFLIEVLPEMTLLAAFGIERIVCRRPWRFLAVALVGVSIFIQALGVLTYDSGWHARFDLGTMPHQNWLWQIRNGQIAYFLKRGTVYLGPRRFQLFENPYEERGFHGAETWGKEKIAWSQGDARFLYIARRPSPGLRLFPSPASAPGVPREVEIKIRGGKTLRVSLPPGGWTEVKLPGIPYQHGAILSLRIPDPFREPGPAGRELGVAVSLTHLLP